jgi:hypothetical protein
MREIVGDGMRWRVREVDTTHVPGARAPRCLIFEAEGVVRRVWTYPENWAELNESDLGRLLDVVRPYSHSGAGPEAVTEFTRSLLAQLRIARESNSTLRAEQRELLSSCRATREQMHDAVRLYAATLRRNGVPPERALVLLKAAVQDGLKNACTDEPVAEQVLHEGVEWCIAAYYAA